MNRDAIQHQLQNLTRDIERLEVDIQSLLDTIGRVER